jgi:hypothetical protein
MKNLFNKSSNPIWSVAGIDLTATTIVAIAIILAVTSVWNDSPIVDEIPHIGAGYSYIATGDHRLNPEHPPLAKDLAGIALKIGGIQDKLAFESRFWQQDINGQWEFGRKLIFNSGNDATRVSRIAKLPELIFFILSAIIIFAWTRKLYGYMAGLIALFLFSFSPTVIAHSRYVTTDMPALFGILIGTFFFLNYLKKPTHKNLWLAGIIFGVAQLTKYSVFLLAPFFVVIAIIYALLHSSKLKDKIFSTCYTTLATCVIIAIGYIFVVWPVYYFHTWNYPPERQHSDTVYLLGSYGNRFIPDIVIALSDKPVIRGLAEYATGLLMVTQRSIGGNTTYFMGEIRNWAWPEYFPVVYFLKEPLAFWGLVLISLIAIIKNLIPKNGLKLKFSKIQNWAKDHFVELTMLLWMAGYWYTSIRANLNIGVRHLMPVYGFTFILLAGSLVTIIRNINSKKLLTTYYFLFAILFGWYLVENIRIYPYYLTYFNQVVLIDPSWAPVNKPGYIPGGHWYVVDSNLDWGQDMKRLAKWIDENNVENISLDYFGWADQSFYIGNNFKWIWAGKYITKESFLADNPKGGYIAVSASFFMGSREKPETSYAWLDDYKPVAIIGNSIFVWHILP